MTKAEYLDQLNHKLRAMSDNERQDALEYYDGYLSDADSLPREITVHLPAGLADSVRITSTSSSICMDGISTTLLEIRSTSGNIRLDFDS